MKSNAEVSIEIQQLLLVNVIKHHSWTGSRLQLQAASGALPLAGLRHLDRVPLVPCRCPLPAEAPLDGRRADGAVVQRGHGRVGAAEGEHVRPRRA